MKIEVKNGGGDKLGQLWSEVLGRTKRTKRGGPLDKLVDVLKDSTAVQYGKALDSEWKKFTVFRRGQVCLLEWPMEVQAAAYLASRTGVLKPLSTLTQAKRLSAMWGRLGGEKPLMAMPAVRGVISAIARTKGYRPEHKAVPMEMQEADLASMGRQVRLSIKGAHAMR